ncbi:MAG: aspartate 1-decarboxylase [Fibrobacteres bacterium]|nr:aspartate 1-decarboxylase [Fibrobacterota bacterium]
MLREVLKSKIHRATITDANLNYNGSITIDPVLLKLADIQEFEKVHIVDINNGHRFETYVILGKPESGEICVNGAAARLVHVGDVIIVMTYAFLDAKELAAHQPKIVKVDGKNIPAT